MVWLPGPPLPGGGCMNSGVPIPPRRDPRASAPQQPGYETNIPTSSLGARGPPLPGGGFAGNGVPVPPYRSQQSSASQQHPLEMPSQGNFFDSMPRPQPSGNGPRRMSEIGLPGAQQPAHTAAAPPPQLYSLQQGEPQDVGETAQAPNDPQIRVGQAIPAGMGFVLSGPPGVEPKLLPPMDGPMGYGVYIESEESTEIIDFYPAQRQEHVDANRFGRPRSRSHTPRRQSQEAEPSYVPFELPEPRQLVDPVDPKWKKLLGEIALIGKDQLGSDKDKERLFMGTILPMLKYVRSLPGDVASGYHAQLVEKAKELGMNDRLDDMKPRRRAWS